MTVEGKVDKILGTSPALIHVLEQVRMVADTDATVLVLGESGVGKELIARRIHRLSRRRNGPLVAINCASVPRDLFESEFFGHVRGAFTGATRNRTGRIEAARGGTLFLDEIGEIPSELQGKLLRVLQNLEYERVGDDRTRKADVRFIAASNRELEQEMAAGRFRRDLYYRLSVFPIEVPPLRVRSEDIAVLSQNFLDAAADANKRRRRRLTKTHVSHLCAYDWPGNVRELKNVVERAFILSGDGPLQFDQALPATAFSFAAQVYSLSDQRVRRGFFTAQEFEMLERQNLIGVLEATQWKISGSDGAANLLGLKPSTLSSRLKVLNIHKPDSKSLYMRLRGHKGIATLARELFGRVVSDPQLSRFWENRSNIGVLREEQLLIAYLSAASGGPGKYIGRDMRTAHSELGITQADWKVFWRHLESSLDALRIADRERREVEAFVEGLKPEIISA